MKKRVVSITYFFSILILLSCSNKNSTDDSTIATLKVTVKGGSIENFHAQITVSNSISGDRNIYTINPDSDGKFQLDIPLAFDTNAGLEYKDMRSIVALSPGKTSYLSFDQDEKEDCLIIIDNMQLSNKERLFLMSKTIDFIMPSESNLSRGIDSVLDPFAYKHHFYKKIEQQLSFIDTISTLPDLGKNLLRDELRIFFTQAILMEYKSYMNLLVLNYDLEPKKIEDPNLSYYSFLKDINLSDTSVILTTGYNTLLKDILSFPIFEIKPVKETDPSIWINSAKKILDSVVGDNQSLFYDILLANSYGEQLSQMKAFSNIQIKNIQDHYKEDNIGKALLSENHKINILLKEGDSRDTILNLDEPSKNKLSQEKSDVLMETIFKTYSDRVIVLDFWATWCGPCIKSINEIASYKKQFSNKEVVFIYITNETSPPTTWEIMKKDIKGEHYYIDNQTWEQLSSKFEIESIPHILIFDKKNKLYKEIKGYSKGDQSIINSLKELL